MLRLGVVSFLNSKPLIAGLADRSDVRLAFDVPARLGSRLAAAEFDAALLPIVDVLRGLPSAADASAGVPEIVSDACIGCDGETMTVRVFSQVPPHRVETLWVDGDSHTSVALARVLWRELYGVVLDVQPLQRGVPEAHEHTAVLLIGDKVVDPRRGSFAYEVDLGGAWRQHTGLPFVFAVWVAWRGVDSGERESLAAVLNSARDLGEARASDIAAAEGPRHGWPPPLALRYLTRCLCYRLDERAVAGAELFADLCRRYELAPPHARLCWPAASGQPVRIER